MSDRLLSLFTSSPPWLLQSEDNLAAAAGNELELLSSKGLLVFTTNGTEMGDLHGVFAEFGKKLRFPSYFGFNGAAFEDCLTDLEWLAFDGICVIVEHAEHVLAGKDDDLEWLCETLERICYGWSQPVNIGEAWDRSAIPFHVVFQSSTANKTRVQSKLRTLPKFSWVP